MPPIWQPQTSKTCLKHHSQYVFCMFGFLRFHALWGCILLHFGFILAPFGLHVGSLGRPLASIFWFFGVPKCMPKSTSNLDAILLDFGRLLAPICCPLAPSRSPKWLPKCHPKAILLPFATWLPCSLHFGSNLPSLWLHFPAFCIPFLTISG